MMLRLGALALAAALPAADAAPLQDQEAPALSLVVGRLAEQKMLPREEWPVCPPDSICSVPNDGRLVEVETLAGPAQPSSLSLRYLSHGTWIGEPVMAAVIERRGDRLVAIDWDVEWRRGKRRELCVGAEPFDEGRLSIPAGAMRVGRQICFATAIQPRNTPG